MKKSKRIVALTIMTMLFVLLVVPMQSFAYGLFKDYAQKTQINKYGGAVYTSAYAKKTTRAERSNMLVELRPADNQWQEWEETIYARGRTENYTQCTSLLTTSIGVISPLRYDTGYGNKGAKYRVAAQYGDINPYNGALIWVYWTP